MRDMTEKWQPPKVTRRAIGLAGLVITHDMLDRKRKDVGKSEPETTIFPLSKNVTDV